MFCLSYGSISRYLVGTQGAYLFSLSGYQYLSELIAVLYITLESHSLAFGLLSGQHSYQRLPLFRYRLYQYLYRYSRNFLVSSLYPLGTTLDSSSYL